MAPPDRKQASDFPPEVLELFDGYVHNAVSRRDFLTRAAKYAVGGMTALAMLESLQPNFAWAEQVDKSDERIKTEYLTYKSPKGSGEMKGYLARPAKTRGKQPGVVVIHENRGLNPYIEDVARRLALHDYIAFAPDALTPLGGYPGDEEKARELFSKLDAGKRTEDLIAAAEYVRARRDVTKKIGAVGFCFGGATCNMLASRLPWLAAAVPFYGSGLSADEAKTIKAALQLHFAATDERVNATWPAYEAALKANKVRYEAHTYPNTQHGFHNDTTPRYDQQAAKRAWARTLGFFMQHLR
ncbi:MAG: dienelactone hydrolase family protein [Deltaproteobacteria bacterium]|nr:dienelactone hydrolase family protein [Deltaproteobacteria bacterium]